MKKGIVALIAVLVIALLAFYFIDVDVTDEGALPDVDVNVEPGELPEADVNTGSVSVGTSEETVTTPDVDVEVNTEETDITVPTIDVEPAAEADEGD